MTEAQATPRAVAVLKDNGGSYVFRPEEYDGLLATWMAGKAFYAGVGPFGERLTIKLAGVEAVMYWSAEALRARDDDEQEQEAERKAREWRGEGEP